jgi:hypothetical protein
MRRIPRVTDLEEAGRLTCSARQKPVVTARLAITATLLVGLFCLWGCETKSPSVSPGTLCFWDLIPQIHMDADTLEMLPGDSVSCNGWVEVRDPDGTTRPNVRIRLSLERPYGFIEFVDPHRRDTTDADGRVYFRFVAYNEVGSNTVIASVANIRDTWPLVVRQTCNRITTVSVNISTGSLQVGQGVSDSVLVTITVSDANHNGVSSLALRLQSSCWFLPLSSETDSNGEASLWVIRGPDTCMVCVFWGGGGCPEDSFCFRVNPSQIDPFPRGSLEIHVPSDTIHVRPGDTLRVDGIVIERDGHGVQVAGDTIAYAAPRLSYLITGGDITDVNGIAHFRYVSNLWGAPNSKSNMVIARSERRGLADTVVFVLVPDSVSLTAIPERRQP